jgi:hypothetical protein
MKWDRWLSVALKMEWHEAWLRSMGFQLFDWVKPDRTVVPVWVLWLEAIE